MYRPPSARLVFEYKPDVQARVRHTVDCNERSGLPWAIPSLARWGLYFEGSEYASGRQEPRSLARIDDEKMLIAGVGTRQAKSFKKGRTAGHRLRAWSSRKADRFWRMEGRSSRENWRRRPLRRRPPCSCRRRRSWPRPGRARSRRRRGSPQPSAPSRPMPVMITPRQSRPKASRPTGISTSTDGLWPLTGGPACRRARTRLEGGPASVRCRPPGAITTRFGHSRSPSAASFTAASSARQPSG